MALSRRRLAVIPLLLALAPAAGLAAPIIDIDFTEQSLGTADPSIDGLAFSAGPAANFADTVIDDGATPTDPYLLAGLLDVQGFTSTSAILAAAGSSLGGAGKIATIDVLAAFFSPLPGAETLVMEALLSGLVQRSTSVTTSSAAANPLQIVLDELSFDGLRFYVATDFGSAFYIDDLKVDLTDKPQPPPPETPVPATALLLGIGALGLGWARRRGSRV